jgi:D-isomer specific 2-hydroxyacid dehydrogenase-like protein/dehydratase family protein
VIAREAGVDITIDDFDRIHREVPVLANVKSTVHLGCLTVTGRTLGENLEEVEHSKFFMRERLGYLKNFKIERDEVIRSRDDPFGPDGGIAILRGNIAPGGAMVKTFSVPKEIVVVIRYEGPRANGMPEMYFAAAILAADPELSHDRAPHGRPLLGRDAGPVHRPRHPRGAGRGPDRAHRGQRPDRAQRARAAAGRGRRWRAARQTAPRWWAMAREKVVIADYDYGDVDIERTIVERAGFELIAAQCKTEDEVIAVAHDAAAVVAQYATISARVIDALPACRVIARYGTGVDIVDVDAATRHGILVTNVPSDWCENEVADHAMALLLAVARKITVYDRATRAGTWQWQSGAPIHRLRGSVLGLLSLGAIARAVSFDELVTESDHLVIQAPLTADTHHLFDEPRGGARRHRGGAGQGQGLAARQPAVAPGQRGDHAARRLLLGRGDRQGAATSPPRRSCASSPGRNRCRRSTPASSALGGREHQAGDDDQDRHQPHQPGHLDVSHQTMSKRSVCTRSAGTPSSISAASAASIIGSGPQMKNWKRRYAGGRWRSRTSAVR